MRTTEVHFTAIVPLRVKRIPNKAPWALRRVYMHVIHDTISVRSDHYIQQGVNNASDTLIFLEYIMLSTDLDFDRRGRLRDQRKETPQE